MSKLVNVDAVIDEIEKHKQYMRDKMPNEKLAELYFLAHEHIKELILLKVPSAEEESFEWCDGCKEYDQEAHCCHRWSKMIRKTIEEIRGTTAIGEWVKVHGFATPGGDPVWKCSNCGKGVHVYGIEHGTYGADIADNQWVACPNCGAVMIGECDG